MGKLIVIEGSCDGIGKTTQVNMLKERLEKEGYEVVVHHFPSYNTPQGKDVEEYLAGKYGDPNFVDPYIIQELFAHDREITWNEKLKSEYEKDKIILLDRYTTSTQIYQSANLNGDEKKEFLDFVVEDEYIKRGIKVPDNVIFLHMPFEIGLKMKNKRKENVGLENDIHETNNEFMKKVYNSALFVQKYFNWNFVECSENDKPRSKEDIHEYVYSYVISLDNK